MPLPTSSVPPPQADGEPVVDHDRLRRFAGLVSTVLAGQTAVQVLALLAGLAALRLMEAEEYAKYTLAFALGNTFGQLIDLGFSRSIIALVGREQDDRRVVGEYLRAARSARNRLYVVLAGPAALAFWLLTASRGWSIPERSVLLGLLFAGTYIHGFVHAYSVVLAMARDMRAVYAPQIVSSAGRLAGFGTLGLAGRLGGVTGTAVNTAVLAYQARRFRRRARHHFDEPDKASPEVTARMYRYLRPQMPGVVFAALQAQIAVLVIGALGSTSSVADVGALSRLTQLFGIFGAVTSLVVEPLIARTSDEALRRRYVLIAVLSSAGCAAITLAAFLVPGPLLFLLGPEYEDLGRQVGLAVGSAALTFTAMVLWTMNTARRWVFWWYTWLYIGSAVTLQAVAALTLDLATTQGAILFSIFGAAGFLLTHVAGGLYGFLVLGGRSPDT